MDLHDWLEVVALILGPSLGVWLASRLQTLKDRRADKYAVLAAIVGTRYDPLTQERFRALSMIDVAFAANADVLRLWRDWHAAISDPSQNSPSGIEERTRKYNDLIVAMAKVTGYRSLTANELARSYFPEAMAKLAALRVQNEVEWNRVVRHSEHLGVQREDDKVTKSVLDVLPPKV